MKDEIFLIDFKIEGVQQLADGEEPHDGGGGDDGGNDDHDLDEDDLLDDEEDAGDKSKRRKLSLARTRIER